MVMSPAICQPTDWEARCSYLLPSVNLQTGRLGGHVSCHLSAYRLGVCVVMSSAICSPTNWEGRWSCLLPSVSLQMGRVGGHVSCHPLTYRLGG